MTALAAPLSISLADRARFAHLDWRDEMVEFLTGKALQHVRKVLAGEGAVIDPDVQDVNVKQRRVGMVIENIPFRYVRTENKSGEVQEKLEAGVRGDWHEVEDLVALGRALAGPEADE